MWRRRRACASPISRPVKIWLTAGWQLAILRAMRRAVQAIAVIRFAWSTRRDLLLETLALRHQLGVLARSNRRFRSADRLLWLVLRRVWSRWRDALILVQPATVDRWHRDRFSRWWLRRTRRPGRPRIDAGYRQLIQQMAAENRLSVANSKFSNISVISLDCLRLRHARSDRPASSPRRDRRPARR
jgi:hypothetical protein